MNTKNSNCCDTDNSECNTQETNCCTTEKKSTSSNKKKAGLGILLLAITFAVVSAFTTGNSDKKASCDTGTSCETSCETGTKTESCCSK